jgi:hypothetical protein
LTVATWGRRFPQIADALRELGVEAHRERRRDRLVRRLSLHRERRRPPAIEIIDGEATGRVEGDATILAVIISVGIAPFFHALFSKAGEDAYAALTRFVSRTSSGEGEVTLRDS